MKFLNKFNSITAGANVALLMMVANAQASDWAAPAKSLFKDLETGLVDLAAMVVGVGVAGYGIWAVLNGRIDYSRLFHFLFGGALIFFGPAAARSLLGAG
ncbi:TrbC/VirB2 family protein [Polycladidibacter hongkongensis]|uniref:TrbC/VirB2 family protein n=1 Tax=Polycladidibacter hongkongensis TaxID=1647556 RepID=UPI0008365106|nr:TrbC/VirB2 family protein [Pseudovibrio hongkongensis]